MSSLYTLSVKLIPKYLHKSSQNCNKGWVEGAFSSPLIDINHPAFVGQDVDRGKRALDGSRSLICMHRHLQRLRQGCARTSPHNITSV